MFRVVAILGCAICIYAQSPTSPQELLKEAIAFQQSGRLSEAIKDYQLILKQYPDIPEIRSNLGAALSGEGRYGEAIAEYRHALRLKPDPQVRLNLALAYVKTGQVSAAAEELKKVHNAAPKNTQATAVLADCYLKLGQNKEVIGLMKPLQDADPENLAYRYLLGTALIRDGQVAQGQPIIDQILKNGDSAEARLLMGTTKYMAKDFAGALTDLQKASELNPKLPEVNSYLGLALLSTGDQAGAVKAFKQELQTDPNNFDANLRMGVLLRQDQDHEAALKYLQHALEIRPGDYGVRYQIAAIEMAKGQLDLACRELESLVREAPQFTEAHVSLATVYFRQRRKPEGERERAIVARLNAERQANEPAQKTTP
jgi:tetratricopeptide (TPR) repeat protein